MDKLRGERLPTWIGLYLGSTRFHKFTDRILSTPCVLTLFHCMVIVEAFDRDLIIITLVSGCIESRAS